MMVVVNDADGSAGRDGDADGVLELVLHGALWRASKVEERTAVPGEDLDAVGDVLGGEQIAPRGVQGDVGGAAEHRKGTQKGAVGSELLDAVVAVVRHQQ